MSQTTDRNSIVGPQAPEDEETNGGQQHRGAIQLLDAWLREDAPTLIQRVFPRSVEPDSWEQLKNELDRDRPSERKLFP